MKLIIILFLSSFSLMANSQNDRFDSKVKYEYNVYLEVLNLKTRGGFFIGKGSRNYRWNKCLPLKF